MSSSIDKAWADAKAKRYKRYKTSAAKYGGNTRQLADKIFQDDMKKIDVAAQRAKQIRAQKKKYTR